MDSSEVTSKFQWKRKRLKEAEHFCPKRMTARNIQRHLFEQEMKRHNFFVLKRRKERIWMWKERIWKGRQKRMMTVEDEEPQSWSRGKEPMKSNWSEKVDGGKTTIFYALLTFYTQWRYFFGQRKCEWNMNESHMKVDWKEIFSWMQRNEKVNSQREKSLFCWIWMSGKIRWSD